MFGSSRGYVARDGCSECVAVIPGRYVARGEGERVASTKGETKELGLLPCPFCGKVPQMQHNVFGMAFVQCRYSKCPIDVWTYAMNTEYNAARRWNRRAGRTAVRQSRAT